MKYKKILILLILFIAVAGFALSPVEAANNKKTYTQTMKFGNSDQYIVKQTKSYYISAYKVQPGSVGGIYPNKIYTKTYTKKGVNNKDTVYTNKLKKYNAYDSKIKSEKYTITTRNMYTGKNTKTYSKTLKPGQKMNYKVPKNHYVQNIKVTTKFQEI